MAEIKKEFIKNCLVTTANLTTTTTTVKTTNKITAGINSVENAKKIKQLQKRISRLQVLSESY